MLNDWGCIGSGVHIGTWQSVGLMNAMFDFTYLCCLIFCMENLFAGSYSSIPKKKRKGQKV